jgi:Ni,Fe-hydrogenase III large subunit
MLHALVDRSFALAGAPGARWLETTPEKWHEAARDIAAAGGRLLSLWVHSPSTASVLAAYLCDEALLVIQMRLSENEGTYPSIADVFPTAARMQRAGADLTGIRARDADSRPWLRHSAWPTTYFPLAAQQRDYRTTGTPSADHYRFVRVSGDGVHEIPVGPVHAGIIEPGHFRFSIVGEKVLKLEERLGYVHKGIEQLFTRTKLLDGHRVAARVSGDSTVAYSWAYCQALEGMVGTVVPARALWLRALALESERIANHLGDLGALGNDAGFAFGLAQFSRLKELWLRELEFSFGQRYLMDFIVPGGVARDAEPEELGKLVACARTVETETDAIRAIYDEHAGVRDRFAGAGEITPELARRLGVLGLVGRASGQEVDLRVDLPCQPYAQLDVRKCWHEEGDVAARVAVRFDELFESVRLVTNIAEYLPKGELRVPVPTPPPASAGVGLIEGWRGPVMIALSAGPEGSVARCHPHDPSWQNWPALEHAVIGNIVPDFPLINKSFNLSYSGHDL